MLAAKLTPDYTEATADLALARAAHTWAAVEAAAGRDGQAAVQHAEWWVHQALRAFDQTVEPTGQHHTPRLAYRDPTGDRALANVEPRLTAEGS